MRALGKLMGQIAPARVRPRRASNYSLQMRVAQAGAGYVPVLSLRNRRKNYKLQETFCFVRALMEYVDTSAMSEIWTLNFLRPLLLGLAEKTFVVSIALRRTSQGMLIDRRYCSQARGDIPRLERGCDNSLSPASIKVD